MKTVKIGALKDKLSMHVRAVEHGASIVVTHRERPVAQLIPFPSAHEDACEVVPASRPFAAARKRQFDATRAAVDSLVLLRAERGTR
jgi:antitoxin (DNA-binding transcriptional repressor) of toxin-antitoxin stability system